MGMFDEPANPPRDAGKPPPPGITPRREEERWIGRMEARVVLPLKWAMLALVVVYWLLDSGWQPPSTAAFAAFFVYTATCAALQYFFSWDRVSPRQARAVAMGSFIVDALFVSVVAGLHLAEHRAAGVGQPQGELLVLYILLVLRGYPLLRSWREQAVAGLAVTALGLGALTEGWRVAPDPDLAQRAALVWGAMLLAAFLMDLLARQRDEMLRQRERQVRSEGIASLGELAAGVAHEINNPIGIIKTYAEFLLRSGDAGSAHADDYATIRSEAERCEAIVRRMLDFANPRTTEFARVDVAAVAREVVDFVFRKEEGKPGGIKARIEVEGAPPPVFADSAQIKQALLNVLVNARQVLSEHRPDDGAIEVVVRQLPGSRAPIMIQVHDNGPGIPPEVAERAFEPFFTRRSGGTGLGLAITRRILEAHGGQIEIWPAANGGTNCGITLPIADEEA